MKTYFSFLAMVAMAACSLTSCSENDGEAPEAAITIADGILVVNSGVDGSLTYYDYGTATAIQEVYRTVNGVSLGSTPNHAVVYGSKTYIVGSEEKTIFIADRQTLKKVTNLKVEVNGEAATPRQAVAAGGYVYVSTFSNAVIAIDTLTNTISRQTFDCGYYSEGMTFDTGCLYVADSNYGIGWLDGVGPSISQIDLANGTTKAITCESMNNPVDVKMVDNRMFILDSGTYDEKGNQLRAGVYELVNDETVKIADATEMAVCGSKIFCFYAPFTEGHAIPTYKVYDTKTNTLADFCDGTDIDYPCKISVHPTKRHVYITSYRMADSGYPDYNAPGYCVIYDETGTKLGQFDCGVCPGYAVPTSL